MINVFRAEVTEEQQVEIEEPLEEIPEVVAEDGVTIEYDVVIDLDEAAPALGPLVTESNLTD